ncbi:alpha-1,3-mannosyltransferase ALG2 [Coemansia reversa NRRL 1564]|uniref:Alpha-1,3/1,6-mannosyltransferase ALG2 n=1 Tax=Coemansia reversa (strain ATCC 12441 / NRRL 1564) TaxID=763665 RepID=A0A2G5B820_COERN|nr:alpha-1,3-mannosyltransferase ALG2 [Coemansia reversa NRRL 1564]|eukprot:PIA15132.1 alpha-1,3-mannosyltransferase ALG2 [Coemansia reversa NRRL 1564]
MVGSLNIAFVHPNLGIGGAERLVVDTALSMQQRGHRVVIYTMHHDLSHCFEETRDGTLDVRVGGTWFVPQSVNGRFHILCTALRSLALARKVTTDREQYDVLFVDQLSAPIPLLKYAHAHILFYCHFPDYLQAQRNTLWRRLYRAPFDLLEELSTGEADEIVVNSRFTQETFRKAFPHIGRVPKVLMPALNLQAYDKPVDTDDPALGVLRTGKRTILSINRFERKKGVELAIDSFAALQTTEASCLVVAGGWDVQVAENIEYLKELNTHARDLGLRTRTVAPRGISAQTKTLLPPDVVPTPTLIQDFCDAMDDVDVLFLPSFSENQRTFLLSVAKCVVYTPSDEHLGIVPLEAMYMRIPVVAVNSGGPRETILHGKTGYLCDPSKDDFAAAIKKILTADDDAWTCMGNAGRERVKHEFSLDSYASKLERLIVEMLQYPSSGSALFGVLMSLFIFCTAGLTFALAYWL